MCVSRSHMEQLVVHLQELFKWAGVKIKPKKCRSLSTIKGICKVVNFFAHGNEITTTHEKSVKSLDRRYSLPHRWQDLNKQLLDGLRSIGKCDLLNKDKVWCIYLELITELSWSVQIYEVSLTKVETIEMEGKNSFRKCRIGFLDE